MVKLIWGETGRRLMNSGKRMLLRLLIYYQLIETGMNVERA